LVFANVNETVANFLVDFNISTIGIILFVIVSIAYLLGQTFLLKFMNSTSQSIKVRSRFITISHKTIAVAQYILAANVIFIVVQILVSSQYSIIPLIFASYLTNFVTAAILGIFAIRFVSWYLNKKHSLGILLYALAFLILAVSEVMAGFGAAYLLSDKDVVIRPDTDVKYANFPEGSVFNLFFSYYRYIDYASFLLTLVASALLLHHYSKKTNAPQMTLIIVLPIMGYTATILDALNIYDTDSSPDLYGLYIFQSLASISGGILFAFSFWFISRMLPESAVKNFLRITALGFILLYISNHVDVVAAPYPPFGITSLSLLPLATYFVLFGLYSSALSLSQDITLRQHLRSMARNDENLLSSIGTAQMETEVKRAVGELKEVADEQEKELAEKTGIETPIAENEVEDYLKQVIEEVSRARKKD
jgi:hypothetical protein